ncbi:hypothetical protein MMG85_18095 [Pseudoxanthomonas sp. LH2527]|uniref:hypothetical protein n=1 Tax=Pseudoxanthomonas sp. LH2527 TaxID=2923249 RepID=UPI001F12E050|nr:hypothetical protein [Pseudoxanthomonas sp. LH2527]MCH6485466.1 hypothetical protein [Pseudoxanthomonas sp. LH2527]
MKIVVFDLEQIVLLGTAGFATFLFVAWWQVGVFWASDTPQTWLLALALVAAFIIVVATPLQLLCRFSSARLLPYFIGVASGPIGVLFALLLFSRYPVGFEWYVSRVLFFHIVFSLIGLLFSVAFQRWAGPNNSFKPNPLRGSA